MPDCRGPMFGSSISGVDRGEKSIGALTRLQISAHVLISTGTEMEDGHFDYRLRFDGYSPTDYGCS